MDFLALPSSGKHASSWLLSHTRTFCVLFFKRVWRALEEREALFQVVAERDLTPGLTGGRDGERRGGGGGGGQSQVY